MDKTYCCMVEHRMGKHPTSIEAPSAVEAKRRLIAMGYKVLTFPTLDDE
ncbi:TPA: hypothetical protein QDB23_001682 [Burkholderia vietnamiensis]|nr:hypothetical protein [Burkholderia vietnamiensis]